MISGETSMSKFLMATRRSRLPIRTDMEIRVADATVLASSRAPPSSSISRQTLSSPIPRPSRSILPKATPSPWVSTFPPFGDQPLRRQFFAGKRGYTPAILYECQNKRLTKFTFRKWLILKGASSIDCSTGKDTGEKKSDGRADSFQTYDYPFITITGKVERVKEKLEFPERMVRGRVHSPLCRVSVSLGVS